MKASEGSRDRLEPKEEVAKEEASVCSGKPVSLSSGDCKAPTTHP